VKLFDGYNLKKELEVTEKLKLEAIKKSVDSVEHELQLAQASKDEAAVKKMSYAFGYVKAKLENEFKQSNHDINAQVWKRLNLGLDEYGKKNGLRLIIGANGMGSVLYSDDYYDLTADAIKFVNKKYEEGN
jgi:outer membrane protein